MSTKYYQSNPFESGLTRRAFLKQSGIATLLAGLVIYKPAIAKAQTPSADGFTAHQSKTLEAVQQQLFPDDGDGPSASDINALAYLQWALTDADNQDDGDQAFIIKGLNDLQEQSKNIHAKPFIKLNNQQQHGVLSKLEQSELGENWISLLVYYLLEALLLDPIYGGNPNGIGWKWLEHQPGYPRPTRGHTYREYVSG